MMRSMHAQWTGMRVGSLSEENFDHFDKVEWNFLPSPYR